METITLEELTLAEKLAEAYLALIEIAESIGPSRTDPYAKLEYFDAYRNGKANEGTDRARNELYNAILVLRHSPTHGNIGRAAIAIIDRRQNEEENRTDAEIVEAASRGERGE